MLDVVGNYGKNGKKTTKKSRKIKIKSKNFPTKNYVGYGGGKLF